MFGESTTASLFVTCNFGYALLVATAPGYPSRLLAATCQVPDIARCSVTSGTATIKGSKVLIAANPTKKSYHAKMFFFQEHARLLKRDFEQLKLPVVVHLVDDKIFSWS